MKVFYLRKMIVNLRGTILYMDAKEYIENGVVGTYAIVSKSAINVDCIVEETPVEGETYFMDSVVYSVVKADDGVVENFFDKNFSIRQQEYLEEER